MRSPSAICVAAFLAGASTVKADLLLEVPDDSQGAVQVTNGIPQDPATWPATFIFKSDEGGCTATAVGARTILTAAHCLKSGVNGRVEGPEHPAVDVT